MLADPVLQEPNRRAVAQGGVAATAVVEDLEVLEQIDLRIGPRRAGPCVHPLVLQAVEEISIEAPSQQSPLRLIEAIMPYSVSSAAMARQAY